MPKTAKKRPVGRPPKKQKFETPQWFFRCPTELRERVQAAAKARGETATAFILRALEAQVTVLDSLTELDTATREREGDSPAFYAFMAGAINMARRLLPNSTDSDLEIQHRLTHGLCSPNNADARTG